MATDRVPDVIHAYFKAVDDRDFDNLKDLLADDALIATASGRPGDPRSVRTGEQLRREMVDRAPVPWRHRVVDVHVHGAGVLVEGQLVRRESEAQDGFVAFFAVDAEGRVAGLTSFRPCDPDAERAAADREDWTGLGASVLNDQSAADVPSVDEVLAVMSGAGAATDERLSVAWRTRGAVPVAVVGRLGQVAEFAAVVRIEGPHADPRIEAAWGPLARGEGM